MPEPGRNINVYPLKFLRPFERKDIGDYPVRKEELARLYRIFKRSSFIVLHGPSGAGKTSLVKCGLVNEIKKSAKATFYLRRNKDFLQTFADQVKERNLGDEIGQHILDYLSAEEALIHKKSLINDYNEQILELEKSDVADPNQKPEENPVKERIAELVTKRNKVKEWVKSTSEIKKTETILIEDFSLIFSRLKTSPLLIFDQFEEIFTEGNEQERTRFGLFSQFLHTANIPVNSLLIIDEEHFGYLDEFIEFVPRIFYNSVRLLDPDVETTRSILEKLLLKFGLEKSNSSLEQAPHKDVIDALMSQLQLSSEKSERSALQQRIHPPFLQIYLKAYHDNFGSDLNPDKIRAFGKIDEVLEKYLRELNTRILKDFGIKDASELKQEYPVIKYLKSLVSSLTGRAQKINIDALSSLHAHSVSFDDDVKLDAEKLNKQLLQEGIVREYGDRFELMHDSLSIPLSNFNIREDLLKKDFETSYNVWIERRDGLKAGKISKPNMLQRFYNGLFPFDLLSKGQVASMKPYRKYILQSGDEAFLLKKEFWRKSKFNVRKWNRIGLGILFTFLAISIFAAVSSKKALDNKEEAIKNEKAKVRAQKKGALEGDVYKGAGEAWNEYRTDRTSAYSEIDRSFLRWRGGDPEAKTEGAQMPRMASDFQNVFYSDYNQYPFYSKSIKVPGGGYILQTKTRMIGDLLYIFALTAKHKLYTFCLNLKDPGGDELKHIDLTREIKLFEPFIKDSKLHVLAIHRDAASEMITSLVFDKGVVDETMIPILRRKNGLPVGNISDIEFIEEDKFIIGIGRSYYDLNLFENQEFGITYRGNLLGEIRQIKRLGGGYPKFVIQYGRSGLYLSADSSQTEGRIIKGSNQSLNQIPSDPIFAMSYDKARNKLLLGFNQGKVVVCDPNARNAILHDYQHSEAIRSIDVSGDKILLGSLDKTASIWSLKKKIRMKILIGHSDPLYNVSFVNDSLVISSGEDGHIKLWDLSPTFEKEVTIPGGLAITKIKYDPTSKAYAVAYKSMLDDLNTRNEGKIRLYNNQLTQIDSVMQYISSGGRKGYVTAFDFIGSRMVMAGNFNQVVSTKEKKKDIYFSDISNFINDIQIVDSRIFIATNDGIVYGGLYGNSTDSSLSKGYRVNSLSYSQQGTLAAGRDDGKIMLYDLSDLNDRDKQDSLIKHTDNISVVEFSQSGKYFASGGWDNKVIIWQVRENDGKRLTAIDTYKHLNDVLDLEFSGDSLLLSASLDHTVKLYKATSDTTFKEIPSLISHDYSVTAATFATEEDKKLYAVSGDRKGNLRRWDIFSFEEEIQSRTYDKISSAKRIVSLQDSIQGKWILNSEIDSIQKQYPDEVEFGYPPKLTFTTKHPKECKWKSSKSSSWDWVTQNPSQWFRNKEMNGEFRIVNTHSLDILGADTISYGFQISSEKDASFLTLTSSSDTLLYKKISSAESDK